MEKTIFAKYLKEIYKEQKLLGAAHTWSLFIDGDKNRNQKFGICG